MSSKEHWWTFHWDRDKINKCRVPYDSITRWRRWLVTLYKFESADETDWRLYLPGNVWLGITVDKK